MHILREAYVGRLVSGQRLIAKFRGKTVTHPFLKTLHTRAVELGNLRLRLGICQDQKAPGLSVQPRRRLNRRIDASFDQLRRNRAVIIESLANRPRRFDDFEKVIDRGALRFRGVAGFRRRCVSIISVGIGGHVRRCSGLGEA